MDCHYYHLPFLQEETVNTTPSLNFSQTLSTIAEVTTFAPIPINLTDSPSEELLSTEDVPVEISLLVEKIIFIYFVPIICVLGIFGNILSMYLLCSQRSKVSTTYALIGIAIADICYLICALMEVIIRINSYINPVEGCSLMNYLWNPLFSYLTKTLARVTAALTIIISIERTVAVTWPMKVKRICTSKLVIAVSIVLAVTTFASLTPWLLVFVPTPIELPDGREVYILKRGAYFDNAAFYSKYLLVLEFVQKIVAVVLVFVCNVIIIVTLCSNAFRTQIRQTMQTMSAKRRREIEVTKTLTAISVLFMITQVPVAGYRIAILVGKMLQLLNTYNIIRTVAYLCEVLNSSLNFVIYVATSQTYRRRLMHLLHKFPGCHGLPVSNVNSEVSLKSAATTHISETSMTNLSTVS